MIGPARSRATCLSIAVLLAAGLSGCDENGAFLFADGLNAERSAAVARQPSGPVVERDVEAPEVFTATENGLWDGRPSLGGVWVAHPDVTEPERVIIRNRDNGQLVVGALFRRERDIPGPRLQVSSDAATALDMLAGAPTALNVTALRREQVAVDAVAAGETDAIERPAEVDTQPLDPVAAASAALDDVDAAASTSVAAPTVPVSTQPAATQLPATPSRVSSLDKPYLQVGIFSVEANANRTAARMRSAGLLPTIRTGNTAGKPFWRVIVGPAGNSAERRTVLNKIKAEGFTDAYAVTN